jgi:ABC-2 type transport system permease protein
MSATLTLARNGVRRGFRSRSLLLMGVVGPLVLGTVLALAFGGAGPSINIALVDQDGSELSEGVGDGLQEALADSQIDFDRLEAPDDGDLGAIEEQVGDGDVGAVLVIPEGYADSVSGTPESLVVIGAGDNAIASSVAEGIARSIAGGTDLQRAVVAGFVAAGLDPTEVLAGGPPEPVITTEMAEFEGAFDAPLYFGPLAVFLFLGLGITARTLLRDEQDGILDRVRSSSVSTREVVSGSAVTVMVQGSLAATVVIVASSVVFGATWGQPVEVAVVIVAFVVAVAGMLGLIVGIARTELQAESWTNVLAFTFAVIGGSFFGGAMMPGLLGVVGIMTPNGAAMRALVELGPGGRSLMDVWYLLAWMLILGVGGIVIGGRLLRGRLR